MDDIKILAENIFTVEEFKEEPVDSKNWISVASYNSTIVPEDGELLLVTFPEKDESNAEEEGDLLVVTIPVKEESNAEEECDPHPVTIPLKEEKNAEEEELEPPLAVFIEPNDTFEDDSMQEETDTFAPSCGSTSGRQDVRLCPPGAVTPWTNINSVSSLLKHPFQSRSEEEKYEIKRLGRPKPLLKLIQCVHSKNRTFRRKFKLNFYKKFDWMCGCEVKNALFCFCCILFGGDETWTKNGMNDLNHLHDCARKHTASKVHLRNALSLAMLGRASEAQQMDSAHRKAMEVHNQKVGQNRYVLNIIINRIKFYGSLALALGSHDESETSSNPDIFHELINFSAQLDGVMRNNLRKESAFEGFSKNIQNEILTCMLEVCREEITKEMKNSEFIALIADETSDASVNQLVIVYRYLVNFKPVERFWGFVNPKGHTRELLAASILTELYHHFEGCEEKLIAQTYNGASLMSGLTHGVQAIIKEKYKQAMYIHCHAHELNLILLNAASVSKSARIFFINLEGLCSFFSNSAVRRSVLGKIMQTSLPNLHKWNISSRSVDIICRNRMDLIECMKQIQQDNKMSRSAVLQASGFIGILTNETFIFWLSFFQKIMPHINMLHNRLKKCNSTPTVVRGKLKKFELEILKIRSEMNITSDHEEAAKKRKTEEGARKREALDVCDAILMEVNDRFSFVAHLEADLLFLPDRFPEYEKKFPGALVKDIVGAYPFIEEKQLCTELSVIYSTKEFRNISGALPLMEFIRDNNICSVFSKCVKLLSVVLTIPMMTSEVERCFSHQRIKNVLQKTVSSERSSALAMISLERDFIMQIADFNERVINKFAAKKERCADFMYKQMDAQT